MNNQSGETKNQIKNFHFNDLIIKELKRTKLNFDHVFILRCLYNGEFGLLDIYDEDFTNSTVIGFYNTLERKKFIIKDPNMTSYYIISMDGKEFYEKLYMFSTGEIVSSVIPTRKIREEGFLEWWNLYPSNSKWKDNTSGIEFKEARPLRTGKEQCKKKYDSIINTGVVTHRELINCLKYEIKSRKIDSLKNNKNQMCFMKGSLSYLNQEAYVSYIDEVRKNPEFINDCQECLSEDDINISSDDVYNSNTELGN